MKNFPLLFDLFFNVESPSFWSYDRIGNILYNAYNKSSIDVVKIILLSECCKVSLILNLHLVKIKYKYENFKCKNKMQVVSHKSEYVTNKRMIANKNICLYIYETRIYSILQK